MSKKLLHKTTRIYVLFSISILIAIAPVFYFVTKQLYVDDADEALVLRKEEFLKFSLPQIKTSDIPTWNNFNRDIKIEPNKSIDSDLIFFTEYYDELSAEDEPYRELNSPIEINGEKYTFVARINLVESEDLIFNIALLFIILIGLLLTGLYLINRKISLTLWQPFYDSLNQIEQFEIDKSRNPQFLQTNIEEFNRLNKSVEKLILKNRTIYNNQREFIENAAHELQTPLAIFQGKLDLLIQGTELTNEQSKILDSLNKSVSTLNRLNKNLLLLSKIDNNSFTNYQKLTVSAILKKHFSFFSEQAKAKKLSISTEIDESLSIETDPILAEILFNNLFLNAIRHNIPNGEIRISANNKMLIFSNTGSDTPLEQSKLFKRFSKSNPSSEGNGLGLSIIEKIATLNNWTVSYSFSNNLHNFSVTF